MTGSPGKTGSQARGATNAAKAAPCVVASADTDAVTATTPKTLAEVQLAIRWRDLDAFNHVNNSSFLTYLEEARVRWLQDFAGAWLGETCMPVVAATKVNYRAQLGWPGSVIVKLLCERLGRSSLTIGHRIVAADDTERLYADGNVVLVWVDPRNGGAVELPDAIRRACAS